MIHTLRMQFVWAHRQKPAHAASSIDDRCRSFASIVEVRAHLSEAPTRCALCESEHHGTPHQRGV